MFELILLVDDRGVEYHNNSQFQGGHQGGGFGERRFYQNIIQQQNSTNQQRLEAERIRNQLRAEDERIRSEERLLQNQNNMFLSMFLPK